MQCVIADDPSILGLGDLELRDRERIHPRAGRLDLLLRDPETLTRYEVELQLGATDASHIIRTIEYWDIERKRYPQYDHCAVIVAEDITSRFLNVINLFNGALPIIAIQMQAYKIAEHTTLVFTKVLDQVERGLVDEDEDAASAKKDRSYWENQKTTPKILAIVDKLFKIVKEEDSAAELNYTKHYIGLLKNGSPQNYLTFSPKKASIIFEPKLPHTAETDALLEKTGLETLEYNKTWKNYRIRVTEKDIEAHNSVFRELIKNSRDLREG